MQGIKEIRFLCYSEEQDVLSEGYKVTPENQAKWDKVFKQIINILEFLDISPEIARIKQEDFELIVSLDYEFTMEHTLYVLKKLEELFKVTHLEIDTEYDDWNEMDPHVCYGFYEK